MKTSAIFKVVTSMAVLLAVEATFASDKYVCTVPPTSEIGLGIEADIEVLSATSANLDLYTTSVEIPKMSEVLVQNPGKVTQVGSLLQLENYVTSLKDATVSGIAQIDLDLSTLTAKFDKTEVSFPCLKVDSFN